MIKSSFPKHLSSPSPVLQLDPEKFLWNRKLGIKDSQMGTKNSFFSISFCALFSQIKL